MIDELLGFGACSTIFGFGYGASAPAVSVCPLCGSPRWSQTVQAQAQSYDPPKPGIVWTRTGGKNWRVVVIRGEAA